MRKLTVVESLSKHLGKLVFKFYRLSNQGEAIRVPQDVTDSRGFYQDIGGVSERALKGTAADCAVKFQFKRDEVSGPVQAADAAIFQDPHTKPFAVIEFRYRSPARLIAEGVMPPPVAQEAIPRPITEESVMNMTKKQLRKELLEMIRDKSQQ
ncbi:hypothetical protein QBC35DRAFT_456861, partial [Podospora australis]